LPDGLRLTNNRESGVLLSSEQEDEEGLIFSSRGRKKLTDLQS
jgi:hypothetical protein